MVIVQLALIPTLWLTAPSVPETVTSVEDVHEARRRVASYPFFSVVVEAHRRDNLEPKSLMVKRFESEQRAASLRGGPIRTYSIAPTMLAAYNDIRSATWRLTGAFVLALVALLGLGTGRAPKNGFAALVFAVLLASGVGALALLFLLPTVVAGVAFAVGALSKDRAHLGGRTPASAADRSPPARQSLR